MRVLIDVLMDARVERGRTQDLRVAALGGQRLRALLAANGCDDR
jgi:hypothetical protein